MFSDTYKDFANTLSREMRRFFGRPIYLLGTVGVMCFFYVFFLTMTNEGQPLSLPIAVVDLDNSNLSRQFVRNLDATQQADVIMHLNSFTEAREEMQMGNIYGFVYIEKDFAKAVQSNRRPHLTFYINNAYIVGGSLVMKDLMYMSELTAGAMKLQVMSAKGLPASTASGLLQPINIDFHAIGNPTINYAVYLLNGLLPFILQFMVLMMTVFAIGDELKERTSREWLRTAGDSIFVALAGKLLPFTIVFTLLGCLGNIFVYGFMHFPMNSSIWWMFLNTFIYVLSCQAIGILLVGITPVLRDAVTMVAVYGLLAVTFTGFTFPVEQMPYPLHILSKLYPMRYYFLNYVNIGLNAAPIQYSAVNFASMLAFTIVPAFVLVRLKKAAINQNYPRT